MANTEMDNYIDSIEQGNEIEFDGNIYIFIKIDGSDIICENGNSFSINELHDDLEFGENHLFNKFKKDENIDEQTNAGMEGKKV